MSTEAKSSPPRGATAILALAALAYALAQTFAIGPGGGARAHRRGGGRTGRASRLMTGGSNGRVLIA
jgi:hypothetical protein